MLETDILAWQHRLAAWIEPTVLAERETDILAELREWFEHVYQRGERG